MGLCEAVRDSIRVPQGGKVAVRQRETHTGGGVTGGLAGAAMDGDGTELSLPPIHRYGTGPSVWQLFPAPATSSRLRGRRSHPAPAHPRPRDSVHMFIKEFTRLLTPDRYVTARWTVNPRDRRVCACVCVSVSVCVFPRVTGGGVWHPGGHTRTAAQSGTRWLCVCHHSSVGRWT